MLPHGGVDAVPQPSVGDGATAAAALPSCRRGQHERKSSFPLLVGMLGAMFVELQGAPGAPGWTLGLAWLAAAIGCLLPLGCFYIGTRRYLCRSQAC